MIKVRVILLALVSVIFIGCASTTSVRRTSNYKSALEINKNLAVLPTEALVYETQVSGKKRLYDFEYNIEGIIADQIIPILRDKGFNARLLTRKDLHDQKLHEQVLRLEDRFKEVDQKIYKQYYMDEKLAFNIDDSIGEVGFSAEMKSKIDLVVISKYSRTIKSSGSQALGLLMAAFNQTTEPADVASLKIAIIELKTGKLIWANTATVINASFISSATKSEENKSIKEFILAVLKPLTEKK